VASPASPLWDESERALSCATIRKRYLANIENFYSRRVHLRQPAQMANYQRR
jgi:hypothetical protein